MDNMIVALSCLLCGRSRILDMINTMQPIDDTTIAINWAIECCFHLIYLIHLIENVTFHFWISRMTIWFI